MRVEEGSTGEVSRLVAGRWQFLVLALVSVVKCGLRKGGRVGPRLAVVVGNSQQMVATVERIVGT